MKKSSPKGSGASRKSRKIKQVLLGIILGLVLAVGFVYFGGGKLLVSLGQSTVKAGEKVIKFETNFKHSTDQAREKAIQVLEKK